MTAAAEVWERRALGQNPMTAARIVPRDKPVGRIASVVSLQPWFMFATVERRRKIAEEIRDARRTAANRRARVKAHPDLAERLVRSLGYARFDQWSGYVPTYGDVERPNDSPIRIELIAILREVAQRDAAEMADPKGVGTDDAPGGRHLSVVKAGG